MCVRASVSMCTCVSPCTRAECAHAYMCPRRHQAAAGSCTCLLHGRKGTRITSGSSADLHKGKPRETSHLPCTIKHPGARRGQQGCFPRQRLCLARRQPTCQWMGNRPLSCALEVGPLRGPAWAPVLCPLFWLRREVGPC